MPEPISAVFFQERGVDAATAAAMAHQFNGLSSARPETEPLPPSLPAPARMAPPVPAPQRMASPKLTPTALTPASDAQRAQEEMNDIQRRRASGEISDYEWRNGVEHKYFELAGIAPSLDAYERATPPEQAGLRAKFEADSVQAKFEQSIEASMAPARSPADYDLPLPPNADAETLAVDTQFREAMHAAGIPREAGNALGASVSRTAEQFLTVVDNPEAMASMVESHTKDLMVYWGGQFEPNVRLVRDYLFEHSKDSPHLRSLVQDHAELFEGLDTMRRLLTLASIGSASEVAGMDRQGWDFLTKLRHAAATQETGGTVSVDAIERLTAAIARNTEAHEAVARELRALRLQPSVRHGEVQLENGKHIAMTVTHTPHEHMAAADKLAKALSGLAGKQTVEEH